MSARESRLLTVLFDLFERLRSPQEVTHYFLAELREVSPRQAAVFAEFVARREKRSIPRGDAEADYEPLFAEAAAKVAALVPEVDAERAEAEIDFRHLLEVRGETRLTAVKRARGRMRSPFLVELLLAEALAVLPHDPSEALDLQEAAERVAARVSTISQARRLRGQLLTRAKAHKANTLRVLGELVAAESLWRTVHERLALHPISLPDEEAELLNLEASLRTDRREFAEAHRLLARAARLYKQAGDSLGLARVLLKRGTALHNGGDPAAAIRSFEQAARLLAPTTERRLYLMTQHNLADSLVDLGRPADAADLVAANESLYAENADPLNRLRRSWLEGRIARAQQRFADAEQRLEETRNAALAQGMGYDAGLVSLDLAELYLATGRTVEVKKLARRLGPVFACRGVHREAIAALLLFQRAATAERLTAEFLARLRRYLLVARNDPTFAFEHAPEPEGEEDTP